MSRSERCEESVKAFGFSKGHTWGGVIGFTNMQVCTKCGEPGWLVDDADSEA